MYDLVKDPTEQHNLLYDEAEAKRPEIASKFAELKAEIVHLQKEFKDDGQYADPATLPKDSSYGAYNKYQLVGKKTVVEAIDAAAGQ